MPVLLAAGSELERTGSEAEAEALVKDFLQRIDSGAAAATS